MKKYLLLIFLTFFTANAFSSERSSLKYFKLGTEVGVGYQWRDKANGFDLSLNAIPLGFFNFFSAKCLYINTPLYRSHRYFYWGAGGGLWHQIDLVPMGDSFGGTTSYLTYPTLESVLGYQFFAEEKCKCFIQLQLAVPFSKETLPVLPGLSFGIGF